MDNSPLPMRSNISERSVWGVFPPACAQMAKSGLIPAHLAIDRGKLFDLPNEASRGGPVSSKVRVVTIASTCGASAVALSASLIAARAAAAAISTGDIGLYSGASRGLAN